MNDSRDTPQSPQEAGELVAARQNKRSRKFGILFGSLMFFLIAVLVVQALRSAANDRQAIEQNALDQGFWIARSLEMGHSRLMADQKSELWDMISEITRHGEVKSSVLVGDDRRVLMASDKTREGTPYEQLLNEPEEHGRVVRSDLRSVEVAYAASFAEVSRRMGNMHPGRDRSTDVVKWVIVTLNTGQAYAHYKDSVAQSVLLLFVTVGLGIAGFFVLGVYQRNLKLEQIRHGLRRFVPRTVQKLIEDNPERPEFEKVVRNATELFLDIESYTRLSEVISAEVLNRLVEKYFSAFFDVILTGGGEINETAGDGIMAIFTGATSREHALSAVTAAIAIRERKHALNADRAPNEPEILVNVGINTGDVLIGATSIKGATRERLTYTASGRLTNLAARLCGLGERGEISLSAATAGLVAKAVRLTGPLNVRLKNVGEITPVYKVA